MGCYLPRHFCPIPSGSCHPKYWVRWRASGGREVRPLSPGLPFPASSDRPQELLGQGQGPSSASWGGEWGLRRVRRDQQATCSKDCLQPYSVGMLRPSWGVPPAQVDFINCVLRFALSECLVFTLFHHLFCVITLYVWIYSLRETCNFQQSHLQLSAVSLATFSSLTCNFQQSRNFQQSLQWQDVECALFA